MNKISLTEFAEAMRTKNRIGVGDVRRLRRDVLPDGIGCRGEAELLLGLDRQAARAAPAWSDFLVAAIVEFVVWAERPTGLVDEGTIRWLAAAPAGDGLPTRTARRIAREIGEEAQAFDRDALAALDAHLTRHRQRPARARAASLAAG